MKKKDKLIVFLSIVIVILVVVILVLLIKKGLPIRELYKSVFCKYIFERNGSICQKWVKNKILG